MFIQKMFIQVQEFTHRGFCRILMGESPKSLVEHSVTRYREEVESFFLNRGEARLIRIRPMWLEGKWAVVEDYLLL